MRLCRAVFVLRLLCLYRALNLASESSELLTSGCSARRLWRCTCPPPACPSARPLAHRLPSQRDSAVPRTGSPTRLTTPPEYFRVKTCKVLFLTKTLRYALITRGCLPCTSSFGSTSRLLAGRESMRSKGQPVPGLVQGG